MESIFNHKVVWWILIAAVTGDFAIAYFLALFYKGYKHMTMVMSSLGNPSSQVKAFYNAWLVALGLLMLVSGFTLYYHYSPVSKPLALTTSLLVATFAIGAGVLAGLFSVNESKEVITSSSQIHGIGSALGFMALCLVPLIITILSFSAGERLKGVLCLISFILAVLSFAFFIMSDKASFQNTIIAYEGLWQRLSLLFMYIPLVYTAVQNIIQVKEH